MRSAMLFVTGLLWSQCWVSAQAQQVHADITTHAFSPHSDLVTLVVVIRNDALEIATNVSGKFPVLVDGASFPGDSIRINRGVGSLTTMVAALQDFTLSVQGFPGELLVPLPEYQAVRSVSGQLAGNVTWTNDTDYFVTDNLVIPAGSSLKIEPGTNILVGGQVNIEVFGNLQIEGTADEYVRMVAFDQYDPWGGIRLNSCPDSVIMEYCFFVAGGGNPDFQYGHSQSQPVVMTEGGKARFSHCFFLDNPGKALGSSNSKVVIENGIISRCDTGGEHHNCDIFVSDTWFMDMPDDDGIIEDDDNDALYIGSNYPGSDGPSRVTDCVFITGEDDGIDHLDANVEVSGCWIQGFYHEGVAASSSHTIKVYNTLVRWCENGIEAGWHSPQVEVDHCTLVENGVGIKFGDDYPWGCEGHMKVTNSVLYGNDDNIHNYDLLTQGPVPGAIETAYTMTNDDEYDGETGCLSATPAFDGHYYLLPGSPGKGLASDGSDMGLVNPSLPVESHHADPGFSVFPNPFYNKFSLSFNTGMDHNVKVRVYDIGGKLLYDRVLMPDAGIGTGLDIPADEWPSGPYYLVIERNGLLNVTVLIKMNQ